jgi:hypothetical protein
MLKQFFVCFTLLLTFTSTFSLESNQTAPLACTSLKRSFISSVSDHLGRASDAEVAEVFALEYASLRAQCVGISGLFSMYQEIHKRENNDGFWHFVRVLEMIVDRMGLY